MHSIKSFLTSSNLSNFYSFIIIKKYLSSKYISDKSIFNKSQSSLDNNKFSATISSLYLLSY